MGVCRGHLSLQVYIGAAQAELLAHNQRMSACLCDVLVLHCFLLLYLVHVPADAALPVSIQKITYT